MNHSSRNSAERENQLFFFQNDNGTESLTFFLPRVGSTELIFCMHGFSYVMLQYIKHTPPPQKKKLPQKCNVVPIPNLYYSNHFYASDLHFFLYLYTRPFFRQLNDTYISLLIVAMIIYYNWGLFDVDRRNICLF